MKPNKFEKAILDAAWNAQKFHIEMTGGEYLWYSHESFLQNFIAIKMFKNKKKAGYYVYVDASPKKIRESSDSASEEDEKDSRQRFDLVFWFKSKNEVKAIVEIKRAWEKNSVMDDIYKLWEYRKTEGDQDIDGYVLYYTDHRRKDRWKRKDSKFIQDRFCEVDKEIKEGIGRDKQNVGLRHRPNDYICNPDEDDPWGFALFRC